MIGTCVLVPDYQGGALPAIVTGVSDDGRLRVSVFPDGHGGLERRDGVLLLDGPPNPDWPAVPNVAWPR